MAQLATRQLGVGRARVGTSSPRLQAQILTFPTCNILWINGYMPCDPQLQSFDDTDLVATLTEVESLVTTHTTCEVVWASDMNWDTCRDNHFTRTVAAAPSTSADEELRARFEARDARGSGGWPHRSM